ncbi:hypothetical protein CA54_21230 [Symmachiella macrocystis]|uniref:Uncharacterized protein n=1 Tax=Symmachiella macrocystis TaxID=2527985 RepID=A0A5C6BMC2_9PLAN|nr:hypothetical protein CA54_21230 [Symmachiella macrocystis]
MRLKSFAAAWTPRSSRFVGIFPQRVYGVTDSVSPSQKLVTQERVCLQKCNENAVAIFRYLNADQPHRPAGLQNRVF